MGLCLKLNEYNIQNCITSKKNEHPRDKIIHLKQKISKQIEKCLPVYIIRKNEYWSSLAKPKCIKTSISTEINNDAKRRTWSAERLKELSKPKADYYEYTEITTRCHFRRLNIKRINDLAIPRTIQSNIDQTCKNKPKVPLSKLLRRIDNWLLITPKRTDYNEHIKSEEEAFSVKKSALNYIPTDRLKQLALPRTLYSND